MAETDLVESGVGFKLGSQSCWLTVLGCAWAQIWVQPNGYQVVPAGDIFDFKDNRSLDAPARKLVVKKSSGAGTLAIGGIQVDVLDYPVRGFGLARGEGAVGPGVEGIAYGQFFLVGFEQLECGEVQLGVGIRNRVHMELKIQRVVGSIIALNTPAQDVRAHPRFMNLGSAEFAPKQHRRCRTRPYQATQDRQGGGQQRQPTLVAARALMSLASWADRPTDPVGVLDHALMIRRSLGLKQVT